MEVQCCCGVQEEHRQEAAAPPPPPPPRIQANGAQLGNSIAAAARDPLSLIKSAAPVLSQDKKQAPARALGALEDAAGRDDTCVWQRVCRWRN